MKKLAVLFSCLALSSCFSAGNHDVLGFRNTFLEYFSTYSISFYGDGNELVSSDYVEENNFKHNVILTAYTGYTVVDTKIYRKDIYRSEYLTANVDGVLNCGSVPVAYQKGERVRAVGEVTIDGTDFVLIDTKLKNFVALVRQDGDSGYFRNVSYPYQPGGILDLNGVGIKVIQATNEKLDYIILK